MKTIYVGCNLAAWCCVLTITSLTALSAPANGIDFKQYDTLVDPILAKMTLAEKIGQMTQAELSHLRDFDQIHELALGSILSGGNSDPKEGNSLAAWTDAYDRCQQSALESRLRIPLLYGIDAVHGHSNVLGAVIFPHNVGLGCTRDPELIEEVNRITALEVRATGINWTFAPCVTVPRDIRWGRTYEGFSEDPALVAELGRAAVVGLQGRDLKSPQNILACAKHFVGDGGTKAEVRSPDWEGFGDDVRLRLDQGNTICDEATLRKVHLAPYLPAIEAGVGSIMPSYSSWNGLKCSASRELLTEILKEELGFEGFLISDYNAIDQITKDYKEAIRISTNAGMDMFMVPQKFEEFMRLLTDLVEEGQVPMERIDDAVRRILRVKAAMGLLDPQQTFAVDRSLQAKFGSDDHRQVAREAVRKSVVLLKNSQDLLPLSPQASKLLLVGKGANDIGLQCGGWTIDWQGKEGDVTTGGTTILEAVQERVGSEGEVFYSVDAAETHDADVAVLVVAEPPYAEGNGDDELPEISADELAALAKLREADIPTVLVVLSGRPVILGAALDECDAVVAAWLPGTEGQGVADVLLGDYAPTGKLSMTWPKTISQEPINVGDTQYDPAFAYGYGETYDR